MRLTGRLNQPQRIVLVVALALALGAAGSFLLTVRASPAGFTWSSGWS